LPQSDPPWFVAFVTHPLSFGKDSPSLAAGKQRRGRDGLYPAGDKAGPQGKYYVKDEKPRCTAKKV